MVALHFFYFPCTIPCYIIYIRVMNVSMVYVCMYLYVCVFADIGITDFSGFQVPDCLRCGGIIKPDVVFFGDNVPKEQTQAAAEQVNQADRILVVGSTLMVFSAFK